jgi:hypothetical protein
MYYCYYHIIIYYNVFTCIYLKPKRSHNGSHKIKYLENILNCIRLFRHRLQTLIWFNYYFEYKFY